MGLLITGFLGPMPATLQVVCQVCGGSGQVSHLRGVNSFSIVFILSCPFLHFFPPHICYFDSFRSFSLLPGRFRNLILNPLCPTVAFIRHSGLNNMTDQLRLVGDG